jgi:hypothetical protein
MTVRLSAPRADPFFVRTTYLSSTCVIQFHDRDRDAFTFTALPFLVRIYARHKRSPLRNMAQIFKQVCGFIHPVPFSRNKQFTNADIG